MRFFMRNKQEQREIERFVVLIYSFYGVNLCISIIKKGWAGWMIGAILAAMAVCWGIYLNKYKTFRVRAVCITAMIQLTVVLYAANMDNLLLVIPTFLILTVLVAFFAIPQLVWINLASAVFIAFYHIVIADTYAGAAGEEIFQILPQAGNVICMELIVYFWLKKRNENKEQMYRVIEALTEAEQSKDDFLSNVSHEIRTPVNTICGMSEMALREHDFEKMREELFDIRDAGHNLMSLVSDILDFSQLQQGKVNLEEEAYNITSTVNDVINTAMARKGDKRIELIVDCDPNIPSWLLGDEKKIRRVIMNLVDNAIKYTNEGGVIVVVNARREDYGINLRVSVKDTGIGMSEESLEKIFESFSQVDTRRNRQKGGVGLGLAISRELVIKMGGTITVRSSLGKGSVFRLVVPQKVLDEKPIGLVENREKLNIAAYFDMEQFDMMAIRDEYSKLIVHMVKQLRVKCHVCRNLAELKRREEYEPFTHVFISLEEYQEDAAYFDGLAKKAKVILVIERYNEKYLSNPDLLRLYKPFYILPVISFLNGSKGYEGGKQMVRPGKFRAPDAHVLVVDDNRMNIRVVEGLLKEYQIKVTYATSGQEALQIVENMCYDFIFMDHMMPEMDGVEALHRIREKVGNYYQKVPIIALTANAAPGNREMFLEEGFNDFVAKPLEVSVLERVLRRNLPEEKLIFQEKEEGVADSPIVEKAEEIPPVFHAVEKMEEVLMDSSVDEKAEEVLVDFQVVEKTKGALIDSLAVKKAKGVLADSQVAEKAEGVLADSQVAEKVEEVLVDSYTAKKTEEVLMDSQTAQKAEWGFVAIQSAKKAKAKTHEEFAVGDLDVEQGMLYCGDRQQYLEILEECLAEEGKTRKELENLYEKQDWKNYTIKVHGLKSTMKSIGAIPLSEMAKALEMAGKREDKDYILQNQADMMEEYRRVMEELAQCPLLHHDNDKPDAFAEEEEDVSHLPELGEEAFDGMMAELEDAMYSLDGEGMLAALSKMQEYRYHHVPLKEKLIPVKKKVEMSDYMSAADTVSRIREGLRNETEGEGGAAKC